MIEKAIREELGVYGGDIAVQHLEGRRVDGDLGRLGAPVASP